MMYTTRQFVEIGKTAAKDPVLRWSALFFLTVLFGVMVAGCAPDEEPEDPNLRPYSGLRFTVLVTDERLAMAIDAFSEDWLAQNESKLVILTTTEREILAGDALAADAAILPARLVGPLYQRGWIRPLAREPLEAARPQWSDVFALSRRPGVVVDGKIVGVPFGDPVFTVYYRADILEKLGKSPPDTWEEYQALAAFLHDRENLGELVGDLVPAAPMPWAGTVEPLEAPWAGLILLARAAPYWENPGTKPCLFDPETMEPRIAEPPMVRAMTELAAAQAFGPEKPLTYTPDNAREAFWLGECAMAVSWPTSAVEFGSVFQGKATARFAELPGANEYFDKSEAAWKPRPDGRAARVPLLGLSGRTGVVSSLARHPKGSTAILLWLAAEPWSTPPSSKTDTTTLYSACQVSRPENWVESLVKPDAAAEYATLTQKTLSRDRWFFVPRIPGRDEYLTALSRAVQAVLDEGVEPQSALQKAADEWRAITRHYGVESQRKAYLASLAVGGKGGEDSKPREDEAGAGTQ